MKNIIYTIILFSCITAYAQNDKAGLIGGLNFSTFNGDGSSQLSTKVGIKGGFVFDKTLKPRQYLEVEFLYSDKGANYTSFTGGGYTVANGGLNLDFSYVEFPISYKYLSKDTYGFLFTAGAYMAILLKAVVADGSGNEENVGAYFKGYDMGLSASVGYQFQSAFGMMLKYEPGLTNIVAHPDDPNYGGNNTNQVIAFTFFYLFDEH